MKIGILGGTFDPIHAGHLHIAIAAADEYFLDKVLLMPAGDPYFKADKKVSPPQIRLLMTKVAAASDPLYEISELEIFDKSGTHTADTLLKLHELYPEDQLYFIMGLDSLEQLNLWYRPDVVLQNAVILCASRDAEHAAQSFNTLRNELMLMFKANDPDIRLIHTSEMDISSTQIRQRICEGEDVSDVLLPEVQRIATDNRLYT